MSWLLLGGGGQLAIAFGQLADRAELELRNCAHADLDITDVVRVKIRDWNAKARRGGPTGPDDANPEASGTAGTIEFREV